MKKKSEISEIGPTDILPPGRFSRYEFKGFDGSCCLAGEAGEGGGDTLIRHGKHKNGIAATPAHRRSFTCCLTNHPEAVILHKHGIAVSPAHHRRIVTCCLTNHPEAVILHKHGIAASHAHRRIFTSCLTVHSEEEFSVGAFSLCPFSYVGYLAYWRFLVWGKRAELGFWRGVAGAFPSTSPGSAGLRDSGAGSYK